MRPPFSDEEKFLTTYYTRHSTHSDECITELLLEHNGGKSRSVDCLRAISENGTINTKNSIVKIL